MTLNIDYPALAALKAIVRTGSFDRAAARLGLTQSAVSQRVARMEDRLGVTLVVRGTPCRATKAGKRVLRHADAVALMEQHLELDLAIPFGDQRPTIGVAMNADSLATWAMPALNALPHVLLDLEIDDQDHSAEWLRQGTVAAAVTARAEPVQGCDCIPLGALRYRATATPAFAERWFPDGLSGAALRRAPALSFNAKDRLQHVWAEAQVGVVGELQCHRIASTDGFLAAVRMGMGWGMNPEALVMEDLSKGRLVQLDEMPWDVPLYWQVSRIAAEALWELTEAVKKAARVGLEQPFGTGP